MPECDISDKGNQLQEQRREKVIKMHSQSLWLCSSMSTSRLCRVWLVECGSVVLLMGIVVTMAFSVSATAVLSEVWSKEWKTLLLSLQVGQSSLDQVCLLGVYLSVLFSLYLVPLAMYSPCIRDSGTLGPKPTLLGHRGAPMLAPENTLMSFESAVEAGVDGLETDVTISADGVPFVMHDLTLQRTTNVEEWDPFGTVSSLSPEQRALAGNQTVPSLAEVLDVANRAGRTVLFDLRQPPPGHPYRDNYLNITLDLIHTNINSSQARVLWLPSDQREEIQQVDPELQQTAGQTASIQELQNNHITTLNLHYSTMSLQHISKYRSVNISVNLYVVNQPWLYSLAWWRERGLHFWSGSRQTHETGPYSKFRTDPMESGWGRWNPFHSESPTRTLISLPMGLNP
ncbi:unnamed protein product [Coregonus sp. 'balchen']|nr:unnamed protein product [Coregonus sp. 'balchen']